MRTLLTILTIFAGFVASPLSAQQVGVDLLSFSDEVSIEGTTEEILYEKAKEVFVNTYNKSPYYLRMNKNTGSLSGGGMEKVKSLEASKTTAPMLNYRVIMTVRNNGYSLKITDFYYDETIKKSDKSVKKFLCVQQSDKLSKKNKALSNKLREKANLIGQQVRDEIRKEVYKNTNSDVANNEGADSNVHW
ncbi:DUF4468 domain-containing protein [Fulvivirgaceae bacterium BMA12]|uniref:DUF4468 domain-containing protein n=1 Tax=Agaribacillus aureus TaxID=3051825 RepID=A0ABT8LIM1_9BACT|nr:DUF4468 domain-containing protein [Fulvivirgaceae bacterium BMA12]